MASNEISIDVQGIPEVKALIAALPGETAKVIAAAIRAHFTAPSELAFPQTDAVAYAVADWIENPPEWVKAPWVPESTVPSTTEPCLCGCASCPPHFAANCTHTTPENPIDTVPTDSPAKPIERPGVTVHKTLAEVLHLNPDSPAAVEWQKRMTDLDRQQFEGVTDV